MGNVIKMQGEPKDLPTLDVFGDLIKGFLNGLGYKDFDILTLLECIDAADDDAMEVLTILDLVKHVMADPKWQDKVLGALMVAFFVDGIVHDVEQKVIPICSHVFGDNYEAVHAATRALASHVQTNGLGATFAATESDYDMGMQMAAMSQTAMLSSIF